MSFDHVVKKGDAIPQKVMSFDVLCNEKRSFGRLDLRYIDSFKHHS